MSWRVARSLEKLRDQIDEKYPDRNRASDGTIGDADHQNRSSDHNPWYRGHIVTALDITHDPDAGVDIDRLTDELQASRDPRIKYVIANDLIMSGAAGPSPWVWRAYGGINPHTRHMHVSCVASPACDDPDPWQLPSLTGGGHGTTTGGNGIMHPLAAIREYWNSEWHDIKTLDRQVSLRDSILRTRELAWESWQNLGGRMREHKAQLDRIETKLDELNTKGPGNE